MMAEGVVHEDLTIEASAAEAASSDPLRALFEAARRGDEAAADALCRRLRPRLYRAAYAVLKDLDEADDVAQDALVRALSRRLLFLGRGSVAGWTSRIALNLAKNRARDKRRRREILEAADPATLRARGGLQAPSPDAEGGLLESEARARLFAALEALPARQADVARLRLFGQLSFQEIAEALDIREENARVTFSLARRRLEAALRSQACVEKKGGAR